MGDGIRVLVAEDQESEVVLYQHAFRRCGVENIYFVNDGLEAIEYLQGAGEYADRDKFPSPTCMLLDLKMPRRTGFEVLQWMLDHPSCRVIPTVVMSNSGLTNDINRAYMLGANAFFTKPTALREMVDVLALIHHFWTVAQRPTLGKDFHCG
jgi:CheY-like chemotaxis protein